MKTKYFKNPDRGSTKVYEPYIPQWRLLGKEPVEAPGGKSLATTPATTVPATRHMPFVQYVNPRPQVQPTISKNVPFAEEGPVASKMGTIPNIGNNVENTWAGVDALTMDDLGSMSGVEAKREMIDNNDYVHIPGPSLQGHVLTPPAPPPIESLIEVEDMSDTKLDVRVNEYVLVMGGSIVSTGSLDAIQEEVKSLVFGEHPLSANEPVPIDDIMVLKRITIKMGVFLGE